MKDSCKADCEHCNGPGHGTADKCCWSTAMEIKKFQRRVKNKFIIEVIIDLIISTASVSTDIIALMLYFVKKKCTFAILTLIPVLLPTFVFTNVYLADETTKKQKASRGVSVISGKTGSKRSSFATVEEDTTSWKEKVEPYDQDEGVDRTSNFDSESTDSSIRSMENKDSRCHQACFFHWTCISQQIEICKGCLSGCVQCFCNRDYRLRQRGAIAVKNSLQRMFKYGFGTIVLRTIAWMWYVKALIYGVKAYRQPKKFMHIAAPDAHWSYELLVRLDFLQAALENAPQCVIQLYALITQPDEDVALGLLTLILSFIDFIRVTVSVHWDLQKGPVNAPGGCYRTLTWKTLNMLSWILIYAARSCSIALVMATSIGLQIRLQVLFPVVVFILHIIIFGRLLSRVEYGVAAQKIVTTVFISLFFLPELDSSVLPQTVQFYYATIIIQNTFFILPWDGFNNKYCVTWQGYTDIPKTTVRPPASNRTLVPTRATPRPTTTTFEPTITIRNIMQITASTTPAESDDPGCLIDPLWISLAVPSMTIFGVIFRLVSSQKMFDYKMTIPEKELDRSESQNKLENSITKLFSRNWTQTTTSEMLHAFLRMLKKEVIIIEKGDDEDNNWENSIKTKGSDDRPATTKRVSFLAARLQADFLASQTFIRESFSLMTRTTRSHDFNIGQLTDNEGDPHPEYNSDSELTLHKSHVKKRPRIPRSRNVSESKEAPESQSSNTTFVQVDLPNGAQFLEMCWI